MALKLPPAIVQKTLASKAINHKEGNVFLWDTPCFIDPIQIQLYEHKLIEKSCGVQEANRIRYFTAKLQSMTGMKIMNERFGYAETLHEMKQLILFNCGQTELLGIGKYDWKILDFKKELFICTSIKSPWAEDYKRFYGLQKDIVDYWMMGAWAGTFEAHLKKPCVSFETECLAKGDKKCSFITRPIDKLDKKDPLLKKFNFLIKKEYTLKDLGGKIDTYTSLR